MKKTIKTIQTVDIQKLFLYPILSGFLILIISFPLYEMIFHFSWFRAVSVAIAFFCWGLSGIAIIIKKESPAPWYSKGFLAIIQGVIIVIASWAITVLALASFIK